MKYIKIQILLILLLIVAISNAQLINFQKIYSGSSYDYGFSVKQYKDSTYYIFGNTSSFGSGNTDIIVIKTNKYGIPLWQKTYGGPGIDNGTFAEKTNDNCFLITGFTNNTADTSYDVLLIKIDTLGNKIWEKHYGGRDWDMGYCVLQASDLNYYIAGRTNSFGNKNSNFYLIKTDVNGDTIFTKTFGGDSIDVAKSIIENKNGDILILGYSNSIGANGYKFYLVTVDKNGNILKEKIYGDKYNNYANSIVQTIDGGYVLAGYSKLPNRSCDNYYYVKIDANEDSLWSFNEYVHTQEEMFNYVLNCYKGDFACVGNRGYNSAGANDMMVYVFNRWWIDGKLYGGLKDDYGVYATMTLDSGYAVVGSSESFNTSYSSIYLVKTGKIFDCSAAASIVTLDVINNKNSENSFNVYPNPNNGKFKFKLNAVNNNEKIVSIYNVEGALIFRINEQSNDLNIDISDFKSGLYFITINSDEKIFNAKVIKQ